MKRQLNSLLLIAVMAAPVFAYDLRPSKISAWRFDQTHELLAIKSAECMKAMLAKSPMPPVGEWNCLPEHMNFAFDDYKKWERSLRGNIAKGENGDLLEMQYLLAGVRWPDDPVGLARSEVPISFVVNFKSCKKWLEGRYAQCANRLCISHFGHLQMAHAMKPSAPWCTKNQNSETCKLANMETRDAIKAWVRWLIPIGKEKVELSKAVISSDFAKKAFDPENCESVYSENFTYQSLFFVDCSKDQWKKMYKFWKWGTCSVPPPAEPEAELKARAIGAILHVIQDSYARGHTLRVATSGSDACSPRISCTKISAFSDYTTQDDKKHGAADKNPVWDASCFKNDRVVDDPITAGAKVLYMFKSPNHNNDHIWEYLARYVFVTTTTPATADELDKDSECFGRGGKICRASAE
jgi:hypothetical protein